MAVSLALGGDCATPNVASGASASVTPSWVEVEVGWAWAWAEVDVLLLSDGFASCDFSSSLSPEEKKARRVALEVEGTEARAGCRAKREGVL